MCHFLHSYIYIYIIIPFYYSAKERASPVSFYLYCSLPFYLNIIYIFSTYLRKYDCQIIGENFVTLEINDNEYICVLGHDEHESEFC